MKNVSTSSLIQRIIDWSWRRCNLINTLLINVIQIMLVYNLIMMVLQIVCRNHLIYHLCLFFFIDMSSCWWRIKWLLILLNDIFLLKPILIRMHILKISCNLCIYFEIVLFWCFIIISVIGFKLLVFLAYVEKLDTVFSIVFGKADAWIVSHFCIFIWL